MSESLSLAVCDHSKKLVDGSQKETAIYKFIGDH